MYFDELAERPRNYKKEGNEKMKSLYYQNIEASEERGLVQGRTEGKAIGADAMQEALLSLGVQITPEQFAAAKKIVMA